MTRTVVIAVLASAEMAVAAVADAVAPTSISWVQYVTMLTPIVLFVMGLAAKPLLENIVTAKLDKIDKGFRDMETTAHAGIIQAIERLKESFDNHSENAHAHPNLAVLEKLHEKIDNLRDELSSLKSAVMRPSRKRSK